MSGSAWQWPALQVKEIPDQLKVGRAVWGKVHGAASDFRWIAASPGVGVQVDHLEKELSLGFEDAPRTATCWRALKEAYCALSCYPSRAMDASFRSGFLEKQLLEWGPKGALPAVLGALLLLPRVAAFDDKIWWEQRDDFQWFEADFFLGLEEEPSVEAGDLDERIERGLAALKSLNETSLAELYSALLVGHRPAFLTGLEEPLPPEALAALLLPLPQRIADDLSIAGWPMSEHVDGEAFAQRWNVLVCDRIPPGFRDLPERIVTEEGLLCAQALLAGDPYRLGTAPVAAPAVLHRIEPAPAGRSPESFERLRDFARNERQRWLEPEELVGSIRPLRWMDDQAGELVDLVQTVESEISRVDGPQAKLEQLEVKADLLRAVALALAPSSVRKVGLPKSGRVPALLFGPDLADPHGRKLFQKLSQEALWNEAVRQSLSCEPNRYGGKIRRWLEQRSVDVEKICPGLSGRGR